MSIIGTPQEIDPRRFSGCVPRTRAYVRSAACAPSGLTSRGAVVPDVIPVTTHCVAMQSRRLGCTVASAGVTGKLCNLIHSSTTVVQWYKPQIQLLWYTHPPISLHLSLELVANSLRSRLNSQRLDWRVVHSLSETIAKILADGGEDGDCRIFRC